MASVTAKTLTQLTADALRKQRLSITEAAER